MKISFTTLSCPGWNWEKVLEEAARLGYDGVELRGVEGEMFLPKARPFRSENLNKTIDEIRSRGLEICCLDTSCTFHDVKNFDAAIDEGKATIDLAAEMKVPYIRVFGNNIPDSDKREETIKRVAEGLESLGRYAEDKDVLVLLETHGDFASSENLLEVFDRIESFAVGILWDINHPFKAFNEPMGYTFEKLGSYIKHVHLKDSKGPGKDAALCLTGEGDLPVKECVEILKQTGYNGWLSLEWEKRWHPQLEEPEVALPQYIKYIKELI